MLLTGMDRTDGFLQFMTVLILFVFVLAVTWLTTRWIVGYQKTKAAGCNLEVIETMRVTGNKYLQIVRAGERYLVIAVGKDEIHMLAELSREEIQFHENGNGQNLNFGDILEKFKKQNAKEDD